MKYFSLHFFQRSGEVFDGPDGEEAHNIWERTTDAIIADYKVERAWILPKLDESVRLFVAGRHDLHDAPILNIEHGNQGLNIVLPFGTVRVSELRQLKIDIEVDGEDFWLWEEIVSPNQRDLLADGYFDFNIRTQSGEISCTAKQIEFVVRRD